MAIKEWSKVKPEHVEVISRHVCAIPVKLGAMARELGVSVKLSTLQPGISGHILYEDDGYIIRINRHEVRERQRYTLAHEIAHFLLHRDEIDKPGGIEDNVLYRSGVPEQKEYEANRMAADLVMPLGAVRKELDAMGPLTSEEAIDQMAEVFQVSRAAMEVRLSSMGLLEVQD